eukprot:5948632-Pleurochrysis_carterae.AAC.1
MIRDSSDPLIVLLHTKTQGSELDCWKSHSLSHGERERCHLRPAWAIPYTGLTMRQARVRPSEPIVSYPGGG